MAFGPSPMVIDMTYISTSDTRKVQLSTDSGVRIFLVVENNSNDMSVSVLASTTSAQFNIRREELLDALIALYPESIAYNFTKEEDED